MKTVHIFLSILLSLTASLSSAQNTQQHPMRNDPAPLVSKPRLEPQFPMYPTNRTDSTTKLPNSFPDFESCLTQRGHVYLTCLRVQELRGRGMNPREAYAIAMSEFPAAQPAVSGREARAYLEMLQMAELMRQMDSPMMLYAQRQMLLRDPRFADVLWEVERMEIIEQFRRDMPEPKE